MSSKKAAAAGSERRPGEAIESFEKAMKALGKRDFEKAREGFAARLLAEAAQSEYGAKGMVSTFGADITDFRKPALPAGIIAPQNSGRSVVSRKSKAET